MTPRERESRFWEGVLVCLLLVVAVTAATTVYLALLR